MSPKLPYFLGCASWSTRDWIGSVFHAATSARHLMGEYSRIFNSVEGNTIFYALPPLATVERWMAEAEDGFRFAPKFPKTISHERRLKGAAEETRSFLRVLEALAHGNRLGASFLQLPPSFNINGLDTLDRYLKNLPKDLSFAVEPRHVSWFDQGDNEKRLDDLLETCGMDKVIFDTRSLFAFPPEDLSEEDAVRRKPQVPVRKVALGKHPMLRFVGPNDSSKNESWIKEWAPIINKWILEGRQPYVFAHAADEANTPFLARQFHEQLRKLNPLLPQLPEFESDRKRPLPNQEQLDLF